MKIFGIGLPRTGTTSVAAAMLELGLKTAHTQLHNDNFDAGDSYFDTPIWADYEELDKKYPGSKFILTWRDPKAWETSFSKNLGKFLQEIKDINNPKHSTNRRCYKKIFDEAKTSEELIFKYQLHRKKAEEYFKDRPQDLLIFDVTEGWGKLCDFLGYLIPPIPFPCYKEVSDWENIAHQNKIIEYQTKDFTICIPTKNATKSITMVLEYLLFQGIELNILIADNDSIDGTFEMLETQIKNNYWMRGGHAPINITLEQGGSVEGGRDKNIPYMRQFMSRMVKTPYIFWLDSDIILPPNSLAPCLEEFIKHKSKIGIYGMRYEPHADHVQMGASFMETRIAKKINWKIDERCECQNAHVQLGRDYGLGSDYHDVLQGRHLKVL